MLENYAVGWVEDPPELRHSKQKKEVFIYYKILVGL